MIIPSGFRFHMLLFLPLPVFLLHILSLTHPHTQHCSRSPSYQLNGRAPLLYILGFWNFSLLFFSLFFIIIIIIIYPILSGTVKVSSLTLRVASVLFQRRRKQYEGIKKKLAKIPKS
jgi:hypothetical protein